MYPRDGLTQEEKTATKNEFITFRSGAELKRQFMLATCKADGGLGMYSRAGAVILES